MTTNHISLRPIRGAEYWEVETQRHMNQRFTKQEGRYPSRRQAWRAAKKLTDSQNVVRVVRVVEARFSGPKDALYRGRTYTGGGG